MNEAARSISQSDLSPHPVQSNGRRLFELCIPTLASSTTLTESDLDSDESHRIRTDAELFSPIHGQYVNTKKHRRFQFLYKPVDIQFVRFSVHTAGQVGIYEKSLSLPPEAEVKRCNYHYYECPLDPVPPIDHRTFFHYLWNSERHRSSHSRLFLDRLLKKLNSSMFAPGNMKHLNLGWASTSFTAQIRRSSACACPVSSCAASVCLSLTRSQSTRRRVVLELGSGWLLSALLV